MRAATAVALTGALAACCVPAGALAAEREQDSAAAEAASEQAASDSFDSCVGRSAQHWSGVPQIAAAWGRLHGSGSTASSLASFRNLFSAVCSYGSELLEPYENGAPVLLEDGHHYRMSAGVLVEARASLDAARAAARANTSTAYYDQSKAVIGAVNAALCGTEPALDADILKLVWDGRALGQVTDEEDKTVKLPKGGKATERAHSLTVAAPLSQSGAAPAFSKEGGSPKISVSKSGRCTLKKGTKKGTYVARVEVAYSADTVKVVTVRYAVR